jgi:hypothetical protein
MMDMPLSMENPRPVDFKDHCQYMAKAIESTLMHMNDVSAGEDAYTVLLSHLGDLLKIQAELLKVH